ncbi:protein ACCELERATED CELL DEATH 6-like [Cornus florida]|uniref:protein ACCELERATED CELL DEATH 6-like n=1 Tax=Cornus florida TaxID=4283 RepID=UPI00289ED3AE|nr:protein ACCELERATED CELL DEATH 6-like [Cornus florida]
MFHHQLPKPDRRLPPSAEYGQSLPNSTASYSVPPWGSWGLEGGSTIQAKDHVITIFPTPQYSNYGEATFVSDFKHMKPQVCRAITMGKQTDHEFKLDVEEEEEDTADYKRIISARGNTILHVASSLGHSGLVDQILSSHSNSNLIFSKNTTGNLALHLAAAAGHQTVVQILVRHAEDDGSQLDLLVQENEDKNTALHLAIKNHHHKLAIFLVEKNPDATIRVNREGVSPLYMAAEAGDVELVNAMLNRRPADDMGFFQGKSLVHAAIQGRDIDVLDAIMRYQSSNMPTNVLHAVKGYQTTYIATSVDGMPSYCISFDDGRKTSFCFVLLDEEGKTPLSFASSIGYLEGVCYFLDKTFDATYTRDRDGSYPIHGASKRGHVKIIKEFIQRCPDSRELLDEKGKNILHVAAESGKWNVVTCILETSELAMLINERDKNGDTPLHLATKNRHARVVTIMTWDKRVDLELVNDEGLTALDVADNDGQTASSFEKQLTWLALRYAGAPQAKKLSTSRVSKQSPYMNAQRPKRQHNPLSMESYKEGSTHCWWWQH